MVSDIERSGEAPRADAPGIRLRTDVVVIGAGQAGLSAVYNLKRLGLLPVGEFIVRRAPRSASRRLRTLTV